MNILGYTLLDVRDKATVPYQNQLVVIWKKYTGKDPFIRAGRYDVGYFSKDSYRPRSRTLYWHGRHGTESLTQMRRCYDIYWTPVSRCYLDEKYEEGSR